jgi:deoxyribonuclease-4
MPSFGSHISIRGGYLQCAKNARQIGADAYQFFAKNPRSLRPKSYDHADAENCAAFCREHRLQAIVHSPYPTNLAEQDKELAELTVTSLLNDLAITEACGARGVVVHFGKSRQQDPLLGYRDIINTLNRVLASWYGKALLLLENQAGEGSDMGTTLHELVQIRALVERPAGIGFCFDTCHAYGSGLWKKGGWPKLVRLGLELGYWQHVQAVHYNDSVYPSGSRKDRHATVGSGAIGLEQMTEVIRTPALADKLFILETGSGADGTHREEISLIRSLARMER